MVIITKNDLFKMIIASQHAAGCEDGMVVYMQLLLSLGGLVIPFYTSLGEASEANLRYLFSSPF